MKLIALIIFLFSVSGNAYEKRMIRIDGLLGQVGLLGDPGSAGANGLGLAGSVGFQVTEPLAVELRYLSSSQSDVTHSDLSVGGEYNLADFESGTPHVELGMDFMNNAFKRGQVSYSGAGIYIGAGLDFELARAFQIGPEVRYVKGFSTHGPVNGADQTTVGDNYSVMIRVSYLLGADR